MFRPKIVRPPAPAAIATACAVLAVASCRDVTAPAQDPTTVQYAPALNIRLSDFRLDTSGVYIQDLVVGSGTAIVAGATVNLSHRGNLVDGRQFDSTATGAYSTFTIGSDVRGFDRGLLGARTGGRRRLIIPPALGYGNKSVGTLIPAGSILIFTLDVGTVTLPVTTTTTTLRRTP